MEWRALDSQIDKLDCSIPTVVEWEIGKPTRHDWSQVKSLCTAIQDGFKDVRYPTVAERQAAWARFCGLRDESWRRRKIEHGKLEYQSAQLRDEILELANSSRWSKLTDAVFFFDPTTRAEMKHAGEVLGRARRILSSRKADMFAEHKQICFEAIKSAQATHDEFWERNKVEHARRQAEWESKQAAHHTRQAEWAARQAERSRRIKDNIEKNCGARSKAIDALHRQQSRVSELAEKLSETRSSKWVDIYTDWIREAEAKIRDIEDSIRRYNDWISEGEDQLRRG